MTESNHPMHFTLECYFPEYTTDSGVKMIHRVSQSFSGEPGLHDVLDQIEIFLKSVGYLFDGKLTVELP